MCIRVGRPAVHSIKEEGEGGGVHICSSCCCNVSNFHVRIPFREPIKRAAQQFSISMDDAGADKLTRNFAGSLQEGGATPTPTSLTGAVKGCTRANTAFDTRSPSPST